VKRVNCLLVLFAAGLLLSAANAHAEALDLDFSLVNSTGYSIKELYVGPSASEEWGDNILKAALKDGQTLKITFHSKATATKWDLRIVWEDDGKAVVWYGYKLTDIETITLKYDDATVKTSAKTE